MADPDGKFWKDQMDRVIEAVPDGIIILDREGRFDFVNAAVEQILGIPRRQIIGRSFKEPVWKLLGVDGKPFPPARLAYAQVLRTGKAVRDVEYAVERPDGRRIALSVSAMPLRDEKNRILAVVTTVTDVTERKAAEDALLDSNERFRTLVERAADALFLHDLDGRILNVNQQACDATGYSRHELLQLNVLDIETDYDPQQLKGVWKQIAESGPLTLYGTHRRKDGSTFPVELRVGPFETDDRRLVLVLARDITERQRAEDALQESEERYRRLVERSPEGISVQSEGTIVYINPAGAELLGAKTPEELIGRPYLDLVPPDRRELVRERVNETLELAQVRPPVEQQYMRLDGSIIDVELVGIPFVYRGEPATQVVFRDITERKEAELRLAESEERYRTLVEASPDAIAVYSEGKFVFVNAATVKLLGAASAEELIGRSVLDFIHPDSLDLVTTRMREIAKKREPLPVTEEKLVRVDGVPVWVDLAAIPFTFEGKVSVQVVTRDITQRKRAELALTDSEERYRLLFESNPLPMWVYDLETLSFLAVNQAAIDHYGYTIEEFLAMSTEDIRPREEIQRLHMNVAAATAGIEHAGLWRHKKKDGTLIDVMITSYALTFDGRSAELVLANDVTELRRAEEELKEKDRAIRRAYVDVLGAVTGNRLVLMTPDEIEQALGKPVTDEFVVTSYRELAGARAKVKEALGEHFPQVKTGDEFIVGFCEALTNAVKHARRARYRVFKRGKNAQVLIADHGPGIDFKTLPSATLAAGFSTKRSLGVGFTIMLDLSDRVLLSTQKGNTSVVLEISR